MSSTSENGRSARELQADLMERLRSAIRTDGTEPQAEQLERVVRCLAERARPATAARGGAR